MESTPLAETLQALGKTQTWLAEQLGVDPTVVTRYCQGRHAPYPARRERIAEILEVDVEAVFPGHTASLAWTPRAA